MIDSFAHYRARRSQCWLEAKRCFGELPPTLFREALLLQTNLTVHYSETGQFEDILTRDFDHPLLYLHFWLLDDLRCPDGEVRQETELRVLLGTLFAFAAAFTREGILDPDGPFDSRFHSLEAAMMRQSTEQFSRLFPETSPFWAQAASFWASHAEAMRAESEGNLSPAVASISKPGASALAKRLAFTKMPIVATALQLERANLLPQLNEMIDHLNIVFEVISGIANIRRDIARAGHTYPILRMMQEAGINSQQKVSPASLLAALVLTDTIPQVCREVRQHVEISIRIAGELGLPTFEAYFQHLDELIGDMESLFCLTAKPEPRTSASGQRLGPRFLALPFDSLSTAIVAAESYLLADETFRESWEVQRRGNPKWPDLVARAFPSGLIVEALCQHRDGLSGLVDTIFKAFTESDFCYYDQPCLPPDADCLGLLLRLFKYSVDQEAHRHLLEAPLSLLQANIRESGRIPTWFVRSVEPNRGYRELELSWGDDCATVEANVLFGLLDYDPLTYRDVIICSAKSLLGRYRTIGLGANAYYVAPYALWMALTLLNRLSALSGEGLTASEIDFAYDELVARFKREIRFEATPQSAALFVLTTLYPSAPSMLNSLFKRDWIDTMVKSQRYDGSWVGEPLYVAPVRGRFAGWYSSDMATTAFCYHALKTYCSHMRAGDLSR